MNYRQTINFLTKNIFLHIRGYVTIYTSTGNTNERRTARGGRRESESESERRTDGETDGESETDGETDGQ